MSRASKFITTFDEGLVSDAVDFAANSALGPISKSIPSDNSEHPDLDANAKEEPEDHAAAIIPELEKVIPAVMESWSNRLIKLIEDNVGYDKVVDTTGMSTKKEDDSYLSKSDAVDNAHSSIIGAAISNIIENLGDDIPLELAEIIENALHEVDPEGDMSVEDAISRLSNDDAQKLYFDIKTYMSKNQLNAEDSDPNQTQVSPESKVPSQNKTTDRKSVV